MKNIFDNKIFKIVLMTIKIFLVTLIVLYLSFIIVQRVSGNSSIMGYRLFSVATGSMAGVYEINDVIAVKDCNTNKLKIGDDIAYLGTRAGLEGLLITHRIIKIEDASDGGRIFYTKGVASSTDDPSIDDSQVLGKVVGVVPVISLINHIVKSQLGFFLFIFVPLVLVIVLEVLQTITDIRLEKHEIQRIEKEKKDEEEIEIL